MPMPPKRPIAPSTMFIRDEKLVDKLEALLLSFGIKIGVGSDLETGCLLLRAFRTRQELATLFANDQGRVRSSLQHALGIQQVIKLVLRCATHPEFEKMVPHLELLSTGAAATTVPLKVTDRAATKLFELLVTLAAMKSSTEVELDHPIRSSNGTNPDVIVRLEDGRRCGFACKVMFTENPKTLFDRLVEGARQINDSNVDVGLVVISFQNLLPHATFLPELAGGDGAVTLGAVTDKEQLSLFLQNEVNRRIWAMVTHVGKAEVAATVRAFGKALPVVLVPVHVGAALLVQGTPMPMLYAYGHVCDLSSVSAWLYLPSTLRQVDISMMDSLEAGFEVA